MTRKLQIRVSWLSLVLLALFLGALCVFANYQLRKNLRQFSKDFITHLERTYHFKVTYDRMRLNSFRYLQIDQLNLQSEGQSLAIKNLRIYIAWWRLLSPSKGLELVRSIQINDVSAYISNKNSQDKLTKKAEQQILEDRVPLYDKVKAFLFYFFDILDLASAQKEELFITNVDIKRLDLTIDALWGKLKVENMYASIVPSKENIDVDIQAGISPGFGAFLKETFHTSLKGSISRRTKEGDIIFNLSPPQSLFLLKQNMKFRAHWQSQLLEIEKVIDTIPLDFSFKIDTQQRFAYVGFNARSLDISKFLDLNTPSEHMQDGATLSSNWTGGASVLYYPDMDMYYYDATGVFKTDYLNQITTLNVDFSGNNMQAQIKKLNLEYPGGIFSYEGLWNMQNLFPRGRFSLSQNVGGRPLIITLDALQNGNKSIIQSQQFTIGGVALGFLNSEMTLLDEEYHANLSYETPMGKQITTQGHFGRISEIGQWHIFAKDFPLLELVRAKVFPSFFAKWFVNWDIMVTLRPEGFFIDGRRFDFIQSATAMITSAFVIDNGQINLSNLMLVWGSFFSRLTLNTQLNSSQFDAQLNVLDRAYNFDGRYDKKSLRIWGAQGELTLSFTEKTLKINIDGTPIGTHNGKNVTLTALGNASWKQGFSLLMNHLLVKAETGSLELKNIQVAGEGGKIESIVYQDYLSRLTGQMGYRMYESNADIQLDGVMELSGQSGENYLLQLYYDEFWQGQLSVYRLPMERLKIPGLEGPLSTNLTFEMRESRPSLDGYVLFDGFYKNLRVVADTSIGITEQGLQLLGSHFQYGAWKFLGPVVLADFNTGNLEFSTQITNVGKTITTGVTVSFQPEDYQGIGTFSQSFGKNFAMLIKTNEVVVNQRVFLPNYTLQVLRQGQEIRAVSQEGLNLDFKYNLDKLIFDLDLQDYATSVAVNAHGNLSPDNYLIEISNLFVPLPLFNPLLIMPTSGQRILGFTKGQMKGQLSIDSSYLVNGSLKLHGGLRSPFSPGNNFKLNHEVKIHNSVMKTENWLFHLPQGTNLLVNTTVNLSANNFYYTARADIRDGRGATFDFDILNSVKFRGRVLGWSQYEGDARMGYLSGRLEFPTTQGSLASLTQYIGTTDNEEDRRIYKVSPPGYNVLSGRNISYNNENTLTQEGLPPIKMVSVKEGDLQRYQEEADANPENRFRLIAGRDFTFYAPSMSLPTIQATLNPGEYVDLFMDITIGEERIAYLQGVLTINRGEVNYFGNKFLIEKGGTILFDRSTGFNPYIDLKADYRVDTLTNRVITMHFRNHVLDTYNPEFTSVPSLSQEQIMAVLGASISTGNSPAYYSTGNNFSTGVLDNSYPQAIYSEADRERNSNTSSSLGAFEQIIRSGTDTLGGTVSRMVENAVRFIPFIDTVTVKTDFISNFALDKLSRSSLENSDQRRFYQGGDDFTRYLSGTSIYFGTYIDKNLFFQTKFDLEDTNILSRYANASQLKVNFYLDFQINTPLFLVDWAFNPMQNSRDVSDNYWKFRPEVTLTLSKTFAFRDWKDLYEQLTNYGSQDSSGG